MTKKDSDSGLGSKQFKSLSKGDNLRFQIGLETICQMRQTAFWLDKKVKHNVKGFMSILDLLGNHIDSHLRESQSDIELKMVIYGKENLKEYVIFALLISQKIDYDILKEFGFDKFKINTNELLGLSKSEMKQLG